ncbi:hypothetical protein LEP1GSC170_1153, partial [Leptospira interrogans serovar Bataviae str. HAI135]
RFWKIGSSKRLSTCHKRGSCKSRNIRNCGLAPEAIKIFSAVSSSPFTVIILSEIKLAVPEM